MRAVILEGSAVNPGDISWKPVTDLVETEIWDNTTESTKWERIRGHELVLTNKVVMDEKVFARFPEIRYVGVCATGYNVVDLQAAARHGVVVTNIPAYSTDSVVQMTFALMLNLASRVQEHVDSVRKGEWIQKETFCYWNSPIMELAGKTLGIYGFGNIGRKVAKIALDFGMKVLVYTRHPENYKTYENHHLKFVTENFLFETSDVLSFHCPLNEQTQHVICRKNIQKMKDGVILINVSRGGLVCEEDLAWALKNGKIAGAGVDVVEQEPMRKGNPLLLAPNILITPHIAWASQEARMRLVEIAGRNIQSFLEGNPLNQVGGELRAESL